MFLEVRPNGARYWRLKYRFGGKEKLLSLGVYPQTSLAEARAARDGAKRLLRQGTDPSAARKEAKREAVAEAGNTFAALAREWHDHNAARWRAAYGKEVLHRLERDMFPAIGALPVRSITPPQILEAVRKIEARGAHDIARRALQSCGQVFRYAVATGRAESDPTRDLRGALKAVKKGHCAALAPRDLPDFLAALARNEARLYPQTLRAMRFMLLTFQRTGEMIGATWDEVDWDARVWRIPAERMKMGRAHAVPLSSQALEILEAQRDATGGWGYIWPSNRAGRYMSQNTLLKALERLGYKERMTGHGFRALAMSTIKEKLGYRHEVVDRQLAHAPRSKIDAAYDRADFMDERAEMMERWGAYLESLV